VILLSVQRMQPFVYTRRVEFCETDAAGIAHFSSFMCYMEQAEHALLRSLGLSVVQPLDDGWHLSWPRVRAECDYRGAARFEEELSILVSVGRIGTKSVTYHFDFQRQGNCIAVGSVVAVCCRVKHGHAMQPVAIPETLASRLRQYLTAPFVAPEP
jgi:acyl-CoA thioester hydrolase